jgi:hypothetical protein
MGVQKMNVGFYHMAVMECGSCGVPHAIPVVMYDTCVEEGGFWTCPNGHRRGYYEGVQTTRKAQEAIVRERDRLKQENARLEEEAARALVDAEKATTALTRHKKRASAGVCPCCNRTVSQMAKHMQSKHPDYNVVPLKAVKA